MRFSEYGSKFEHEERVSHIVNFFTLLAILISCLGVFGLATYLAEQRIKEIGIRKVLGASVFSVWRLLSKEFILLVLVSCFISIPLSWYFSHEWLRQFPLRISVSWWIFGIASIAALAITLMTVSFQALKAATRNPALSLRTEG